MRSVTVLIAAFFCFSLVQPQARADVYSETIDTVIESVNNVTDILFPGVTNIRLGLGPVVSPDYEGSDEYRVRPLPLVSFRYRDLLEVNNNNLRVNLFGFDSGDKTRRFKAGPQIRVDLGRDENDNPALAGLGEVDIGVELGLFGSYQLGPARTRIRILHDIAGGHSGTKIIGDVRFLVLKKNKLVVTGSLSSTWADSTYMDSYFAVNPPQSLASGLPVFNTGAGIKDVRAVMTANYELSPRWAVLAQAGYKRLLGDAADSPIVSMRGSANQATAGVFLILGF
ncbi:MAG: MipA/OmpV family protein [Gammaproteobacteria bacterium]